ncbi:hypothetical protein [Streptomyces pinistramenti]|uniref:hypothetical protein n=1 Tax=Streptomyces pinistramenti TaxID=2884812 RepID=UPI001D0686FA|nr:hypothetical protein [Streptomyces pinistramenti]MCB5910717.1 hypothetical protein [Streptomyces pinistramenti]
MSPYCEQSPIGTEGGNWAGPAAVTTAHEQWPAAVTHQPAPRWPHQQPVHLPAMAVPMPMPHPCAPADELLPPPRPEDRLPTVPRPTGTPPQNPVPRPESRLHAPVSTSDRRRLDLQVALTAAGVAPAPEDAAALRALAGLDDATTTAVINWIGTAARTAP